jgi:hypothetical protein
MVGHGAIVLDRDSGPRASTSTAQRSTSTAREHRMPGLLRSSLLHVPTEKPRPGPGGGSRTKRDSMEAADAQAAVRGSQRLWSCTSPTPPVLSLGCSCSRWIRRQRWRPRSLVAAAWGRSWERLAPLPPVTRWGHSSCLCATG